MKSLRVTSHVGRDLIQSAASFKTDYAVVWEYVVNSLQYVEDGVAARVQVLVRARKREIEVSDNGRGMSHDDLRRYFTMHGENIDRALGRPGRGKFGTGKSAAFGIGTSLTLETRRNGRRNSVRLTRAAIDASSGDDIELEWLVQDERCDEPNGTTVTVGGIALAKINTQAIIEYIERHLQTFRKRMPEVAVNEHVCQYREPQIAEGYSFAPNAEQLKTLGNIRLTVNVSPTPLPDTEVGVSITAGAGNLIAIETGGVDKKELGNYLFGEVDVPAIETYKSTIEPFDTTRSLQLNPQHPVCVHLIPFIASKLEHVRGIQLRKLNEQRKTEQARRLASEAERIAEVLNKDFRSVMSKLTDIRAVSSRSGSAEAVFGSAQQSGSDEDLWLEGLAVPGNIEKAEQRHTDASNSAQKERQDPEIVKTGEPNSDGTAAVDPAGGRGKRRRPQGGFNVEYKSLGEQEDRSKYDRTTLTILINLDHPAARNALKGGSVEDPTFKRLSYEIAFTEYSVALGYEMAERDPDVPADDLLYEVRSTLNRVAASAAGLYA